MSLCPTDLLATAGTLARTSTAGGAFPHRCLPLCAYQNKTEILLVQYMRYADVYSLELLLDNRTTNGKQKDTGTIPERHRAQKSLPLANLQRPRYGYELRKPLVNCTYLCTHGEHLLLKHMLKYALRQKRYVSPPPVAKFPLSQLMSATARSLPMYARLP